MYSEITNLFRVNNNIHLKVKHVYVCVCDVYVCVSVSVLRPN